MKRRVSRVIEVEGFFRGDKNTGLRFNFVSDSVDENRALVQREKHFVAFFVPKLTRNIRCEFEHSQRDQLALYLRRSISQVGDTTTSFKQNSHSFSFTSVRKRWNYFRAFKW